VTRSLNADGWKVVRVWEHQVKEDLRAIVARIVSLTTR
jgi:very-short-patch-repair endonuclease